MTEETGKRYKVNFYEWQFADSLDYYVEFFLTDTYNPDFNYKLTAKTLRPWSELAQGDRDSTLAQIKKSFKAKISAYERDLAKELSDELDGPTPWWREYDKEITS